MSPKNQFIRVGRIRKPTMTPAGIYTKSFVQFSLNQSIGKSLVILVVVK
jgi:hypothetical protein